MKRSWQISHFCYSVMTNPLKIFLHSHLLCGKFMENIVNTPSLTKATHEPARNQFIILRHFILATCHLGRIFFKAWILSLRVIGICLALSYHRWNYQDLKVSPALEDVVALIQSPWELLKGSSWNCSFGLHCDTPWSCPSMQLRGLEQELSLVFSLQILLMLDSGTSLATSRKRKGHFPVITGTINDIPMS